MKTGRLATTIIADIHASAAIHDWHKQQSNQKNQTLFVVRIPREIYHGDEGKNVWRIRLPL
jgi:hypothetical protein